MRALLINQVYWPDVAATAQHADDLAQHLVRHGHEVHVIASRSVYGKKGAALPKREQRAVLHDDGTPAGSVSIHRVGISLFGKASIAARILDFGLFYFFAALKAFTVKRPDVTVCFTTPPFIALLGWALRLVRRSKFVYWVMDLYPDLPVACGVMKPGSPITRFFEAVNRFCLRRADRAVVLGRCMQDRVLDKGTPADRVIHIGVWSEPSEVAPVARDANTLREHWKLGDRFTVMYSGNFGLGHDVGTMLDAAEQLKDDDRVRFLFVGGGKKKAVVDRVVREKRLKNCVLDDYQPRERLAESLSAGDLHLATLTEGIEGIMVPCKLFGIMAAERPCVFIGHPDSELSRVLAEHNAGFTVRQGDADGLIAIITRLASDHAETQRTGANARRALAEAYDQRRACERWRELLEAVVAGDPVPTRTNAPASTGEPT
ncbi:MAG: glycosyltransferase family 4 protein [Planctomycetota bacterium]